MKKEQTENTIILEDKISNELNNTINKIMSIQWHYNLNEYFLSIKNKTMKEQNQIYENLINYYLKGIKKLYNIETIEDEVTTEEIFEFFSERIESIPKEIDPVKFTEQIRDIDLEADDVVNDLVSKLDLTTDQKLNLPVSISDIKEFSIQRKFNNEVINEVIKKIILNLAIIYNKLLKKKNSTSK